MTRIEIDGNDLVIHISWIDALLDLQRTVRVPLNNIIGVYRAVDEANDPPVLQMPGIWAPGTIMAGRFIGRGWKAMWAVHDVTKAIAIYVRGEQYDKFVVEVAEPDQAIRTIIRAVATPR